MARKRTSKGGGRPAGWAIRREGEVEFSDLAREAQDDVVSALSGEPLDDLGERSDEVRVFLTNGGTLPLVSVATTSLKAELRGRWVSPLAVKNYVRARKSGATFPPIVIDSQKRLLHEGGHRTASALMAGDPRILAIDVADARIVETESPFARDHFFSAFEFG